MEKSESIKNIAAALMQFQSNAPTIPKEETNPYFKSKYASLSTIIKYITPELTKQGLAYTQVPNGSQLVTMLMHVDSGEYITAHYDLTLVKQDPQAMGSAITYGRRYSLSAILGLDIDNDDDDGNAATPQSKTTTQPIQAKKSTQPTTQTAPTGATIEVTYQGKPIQLDAASPRCPKCEATMWDNREKKASGEYKPTSADFSCSDKSCITETNQGAFRTSVWIEKKKQEVIDTDVSIEDIPF